MDDLGVLLRAARERRNLSARQASLRSGLSESFVGKVEAANMHPTLPNFAALVDTYRLNDREIALLVRAAITRTRSPAHDPTPDR